MHRGAWWATVHGVSESDTTEQLTLSLFKDIDNEVDKDICTRTSITTLL